jgi:hypothetical protein
MFGFFKSRSASNPADWQRQWHDLFDTDPAGEGPRPDPLPDWREDFRLHFAIWLVRPEVRAKAFSLLPAGDEMAGRAEQYLTQPPLRLDQASAEALLRDGLKRLHALVTDAPDAGCLVHHTSEADQPYPGPLSKTDSPLIALDDQLPQMALEKFGKNGEDAFFFLGEPTYRANSFYQTAHWISWPLCAPDGAPDVYEPFSQLVSAGWVPGWHSDGSVVLFQLSRSA